MQSFLAGSFAIVIAALFHLPFPFILFYATIVFMQLIEYLVWTYGSDPDINFYLSVSASFLLILQPVASILTLPTGRMPVLFAYLMIGSLYHILRDKSSLRKRYQMYPAENGHLRWNWMDNDPSSFIGYTVYFIFLLAPLFWKGDPAMIAVILSTLGLSLYTFSKSRTWGSMWCWLVNGIMIIACGHEIWNTI